MKLSDKLDDITRKFWSAWRTWRLGQGWSLGVDLPSQKVSPHLVANFDQLTPDGSEWFRQHTALMLWALEDLPLEAWGFAPKPQPIAADGAEPRLRVEVEVARQEATALRARLTKIELERDQEVQKADVERSQRAAAEDKLSRLEAVVTELKETVPSTAKAVEAALAALKGGDQKKVATNLAEALALLTGEPVEPEAEEPEAAPGDDKPKAEKKPRPRKKKKTPDWG
jgi:hypothetical protein